MTLSFGRYEGQKKFGDRVVTNISNNNPNNINSIMGAASIKFSSYITVYLTLSSILFSEIPPKIPPKYALYGSFFLFFEFDTTPPEES